MFVQDQIDKWKKEVTTNHCHNCRAVCESPFCCVRCKYEWMQAHPDLRIDFKGNIVKKC